MKNENLCSIFIFLEIEKWQMKIYVQFLFFSEHGKMKKENLCQILIFQKNEKWNSVVNFHFFFLDS